MTVAQHTTITCDEHAECPHRVEVDRGLVDARTEAGLAGWVNELVFIGIERRPLIRDFCPEHNPNQPNRSE